MSNLSAIGFKDLSGVVTAVGCHEDGYLSRNGVYLDRFYSDRENAKGLVSNGRISRIAENLFPLVEAPTEEDLKIMSSFNRNFTVFSKYLYPDSSVKNYVYQSESDFINDDGFEFAECIYLFDEMDDNWYVLESGKRFELHRLLEDEGYFYEYYLLTKEAMRWKGDYDSDQTFIEEVGKVEWRKLRDAVVTADTNCQPPQYIVFTCGLWFMNMQFRFDKHQLQGKKIIYSETDNKYSLIKKLKSGKESVIISSDDINEITLWVCKKYKINIFHRPIY